MRGFKSPLPVKPTNMHKKSSINFIKNVASPYKSANNLYLQRKNIDNRMPNQIKFTHQTQNLVLLIKHENIQSTTNNMQNMMMKKNNKQNTKNSNPSTMQNNEQNQRTRVIFSYGPTAQIRNLITFLHQQLSNNLVYFKSLNPYIDYILNIKQFKIKQLVEYLKKYNDEEEYKSNELQIIVCEYNSPYSNNYLKNFQIIKCIGSGGFSKVFLVRGYGKLMAMKVINKQYIIQNEKQNIINNQKNILTLCSDHPFITKLYLSFETKSYLIFVMQFCNGGELFNLLRNVRRMTQENAKFYFIQTLTAISYLHKKGIIYRDIKPQNIILDYQGHVRLADYGLSKIMDETRDAKTYSFCGSAEYMAPEMLLKKGHSFDIDFYCLGALLYELVIGLPPYYSRNQSQLFSNIIHNQLQFPEHVNLSPELKNFLSHLLQKDTESRYQTLEQILQDNWMKGIRIQQILMKTIKPPYKTDMFQYNFDDSDFVSEEKQFTEKILQEQSEDSVEFKFEFEDFFYEAKQIKDLKDIIKKDKQRGMFMKLPHHSNNDNFTMNDLPTSPGQLNHKRKASNTSTNRNYKNSQNHYEPSLINSNTISINMSNASSQVYIPTTNDIPSRQFPLQNGYQSPSFKRIEHTTSQINHPEKNSLTNVRSVGRIISKDLNTQPRISDNSRGHVNISNNSTDKRSNTDGFKTIYTQKLSFQQMPIHKNHHNSNINISNPLHQNKAISPRAYVSTVNASNQKSFSYIRQPYSGQKTRGVSNAQSYAVLDIHNLKVKNSRNYSLENRNDIYSGYKVMNSRAQTVIYPSILNQPNNYQVKNTATSYQLHKGYLQSFRDRLVPNKVKKTSIRNNGEKFSASMLSNLHYIN